MWKCLAFALICSLVSVAAHATPVLLYDVNFNADTIGLAPSTGVGPAVRTMPSAAGVSSEGGALAVVASHGPLTDQPLEMTAVDRGSRPGVLGGASIVFGLNTAGFSGFDVYRFEAQMTTDDLSGTSGVGVLFDQPFHTTRIMSNLSINTTQSGSPVTPLGTYMPGALLSVDIMVDLLNDSWSIALDGAPAFTGPTAPGLLFTQFRVGFTSHNTQPRSVYVDNIRITGEHTAAAPEPGTGTLFLVGLAAVFRSRRN